MFGSVSDYRIGCCKDVSVKTSGEGVEAGTARLVVTEVAAEVVIIVENTGPYPKT